MPEQRLQKTRDAYTADGKTVTTYSGEGIRVTQPSTACRITQAQLAAEQAKQ